MALLDRKVAGDLQRDYRAGLVAATICNAHGGIDGRAAVPADFFPRLGELDREQTTEEQAQLLTFLAAVYGQREETE